MRNTTGYVILGIAIVSLLGGWITGNPGWVFMALFLAIAAMLVFLLAPSDDQVDARRRNRRA